MIYCKTCKAIYFKYPMIEYNENKHYVQMQVKPNEDYQHTIEHKIRHLKNMKSLSFIGDPKCPHQLKEIIRIEKEQRDPFSRSTYIGDPEDYVVKHDIIHFGDLKNEEYAMLQSYIKGSKIDLSKLKPAEVIEIVNQISNIERRS